jgi:hypothetical protein
MGQHAEIRKRFLVFLLKIGIKRGDILSPHYIIRIFKCLSNYNAGYSHTYFDSKELATVKSCQKLLDEAWDLHLAVEKLIKENKKPPYRRYRSYNYKIEPFADKFPSDLRMFVDIVLSIAMLHSDEFLNNFKTHKETIKKIIEIRSKILGPHIHQFKWF